MAKGGKRPGAGRKPHKIKGLMKYMPADTAAAVLAEINAQQIWRKLAASKDERIRLDTLKYLTDRAYGKAPQAIHHSGPGGEQFRVIIEHVGSARSAST